jgi:hypothetical protein
MDGSFAGNIRFDFFSNFIFFINEKADMFGVVLVRLWKAALGYSKIGSKPFMFESILFATFEAFMSL